MSESGDDLILVVKALGNEQFGYGEIFQPPEPQLAPLDRAVGLFCAVVCTWIEVQDTAEYKPVSDLPRLLIGEESKIAPPVFEFGPGGPLDTPIEIGTLYHEIDGLARHRCRQISVASRRSDVGQARLRSQVGVERASRGFDHVTSQKSFYTGQS